MTLSNFIVGTILFHNKYKKVTIRNANNEEWINFNLNYQSEAILFGDFLKEYGDMIVKNILKRDRKNKFIQIEVC